MMSGRLIYWDSCLFLAYFKNETRPAGEMEGLLDLAKEVDAGKKVLVTSVVTRMEILRSTLTKEQNGKYDLLFKRRNFQEMPIDKRVVALSHDLRDYYQQEKAKDGLATLTTPDSIHLATAIIYKVGCFYTFDGKDKPKKARAILPLDGNVAGHNLSIQKPLAKQTHFLHKMDAVTPPPKPAPTS
jgi:predicted nucleic acid-binding protein